ncbi:MAG: hypothetical protein ACD_3C00208G0006 [uncultured bacterium (gcode 4)]|uniref:Guanylate kinase-like domain-containing protein n=1 Tax=uncultured bacterium (gcode 4) TaxID=1234023 RepID=K2GB65_9BACT|nr:MAG: hypothetical protein ACD_3C00208G0006 [uncultured bacterium (gcode 4)]
MIKQPLYIISGCSWVGKNVVWEQIEKTPWIKAKKVMTFTTREKRIHENHASEYHFISKEEFNKKIDSWEMLEWTVTNSALYWSTNDELEKIISHWLIPVYIIDVKWHNSIREKLWEKFDITSVFILPPSFEILEERLEARWTESDERMLVRLQTAKEELEHIAEYDYFVINNEIEQCAKEIIDILKLK